MYIDPHVHMVSRTTDDYERMALAGCVAITEPAFWAGYDRSSAQGFFDYFRTLTDYEPKRAQQYGIAHHTWLCINPKEADDVVFGREVLSMIPEFLDQPNVLGIGEIGLNKNTRNEHTILEEHIALAQERDLPILVHTPHLEDKLKGDDKDAIEAAVKQLNDSATELGKAVYEAAAAESSGSEESPEAVAGAAMEASSLQYSATSSATL